MTSFSDALTLAKQEQNAGNIASYYIEGGAIYAESPDGGFYTWFSPEHQASDPHFDI